jgi:hypothetical protein
MEEKKEKVFKCYPIFKQFQAAVDKHTTKEEFETVEKVKSSDFSEWKEDLDNYRNSAIIMLNGFFAMCDEVEENDRWLLFQYIIYTLGGIYETYSMVEYDYDMNKTLRLQYGMIMAIDAAYEIISDDSFC